MSSFIFVVTLLFLEALLPCESKNDFLNPPSTSSSTHWTVGSKQDVQWETDSSTSYLVLFVIYKGPRAPDSYEITTTSFTSYTWTVNKVDVYGVPIDHCYLTVFDSPALSQDTAFNSSNIDITDSASGPESTTSFSSTTGVVSSRSTTISTTTATSTQPRLIFSSSSSSSTVSTSSVSVTSTSTSIENTSFTTPTLFVASSSTSDSGPQNTSLPAPPLVPTKDPSLNKNSRSLAIGLGVGLGLGIPILLFALFLAVRRIRKKNSNLSAQLSSQGNPYGIEVPPSQVQLGGRHGIAATVELDGSEPKPNMREANGIEVAA